MAAAPPVWAPKALMDEIIEEIILRLPPADPASLVRAALVCKPWCGLISSPRFRRRFRAFHRTAPTLGLLCNTREKHTPYVASFVPTSSVRPPRADQLNSLVCDARHGRVLLYCWRAEADPALLVWNPMTNEQWQLPSGPSLFPDCDWSVAVLCAAIGACDHIDCPSGAFLVVALTTVVSPSREVTLWVYSSESGTWRKQSYVVADANFSADLRPTAVVGNTVYFPVNGLKTICSYDLESWETSVIQAPPMSGHCATVVISSLITVADGGLGVARLDEDARLSVWSMEANPNGENGWTQTRVIELLKLLSINALSIVGFSHDAGILFMWTGDGLSTIDLKSGLKNKVCEEVRSDGDLDFCDVDVFPYTTFYTPVLQTTSSGVGPRLCGSTASQTDGA